MNNFVFGLAMLIVGMGGTLATLFLITLVIRALGIFFPVRPDEKGDKK